MTLERAIDFPFAALITTAKTWIGGHGIAEAARSDAEPWQERLRGNRTVKSRACCCQARADAWQEALYNQISTATDIPRFDQVICFSVLY